MTVKHVNFYENLAEAHIRLLRTFVLYDGEPYSVFAVCSHRDDGVFRIYLDPIDYDGEKRSRRTYPEIAHISPADEAVGGIIDKWLETEAGKTSGMLRKRMDSKHFNRFRPYPLGMCNYGARTFYLERQPARLREQGLTKAMVAETHVTLGKTSGPIKPGSGLYNVEMYSSAFKACIKGEHPSAADVLLNLVDPDVENEAVAFHRNFAFVRGPIDMIFLAYKTDTIGLLTRGDFSEVKLGSKFKHTREAVAELGLFSDII